MSAPPYQKLFWGSYHKHTAHLSHAREHGAYLLLIGALWNNDGRLPADDETLAAFAKLTLKEWANLKPKLMPMFRIVRGKLTQPRVTEDLAKYQSTSGKRKEAGKTGGTASARIKRENRQAIATDLPTKPEPEPEPKKDTPPKPPRGPPDGFEAWWSAYPKKVAKRAAEKAYAAALKRADAATLLVGVKAAPWPDEERFIPNPATWLNGDRWLDGGGGALFDRTAAWTDAEWCTALRLRRESGDWSDMLGPPPGAAGCRVPSHLLVSPISGAAA